MDNLWAWVVGVLMGVCIVALLVYGRGDRQDYWAAKTAPVHHTQATPPATPRLHLPVYRR